MRIAVLGAGGGTGRQVVEQGLARGHEMTALVRRPEALCPLGDRVKTVVGDALTRPRCEPRCAGRTP